MEENEVSKSNKIKIIVITALVFLLSIAGVTYAYFTIQIVGNDTASSMRLRTANYGLIYNDVQIISGEYEKPGWTDTKTLTVTNTGNVTAYYTIIWRDLINTLTNNELVISATCSSSSGTCPTISETVVPTAATETHNVAVKGNIEIAPGVTHTYTVTALFKETGSNQNYNQNKYFNGTLNITDGSAPATLSLLTDTGTSGLSTGDVVRATKSGIDNQDFYVVSTNASETVLLAKYNLLVGDVYDVDSEYNYTLNKTMNSNNTVGYGLQSSSAKGYVDGDTQYIGIVPFSGTNYWDNSTCQYAGTSWNCTGTSGLKSEYATGGASYGGNPYPNVYNGNLSNVAPSIDYTEGYGLAQNNGYTIAYYIEEYINTLGINGTGRLLTVEEANTLGCSSNSYTCSSATSWLNNGSTFWLGSADNGYRVWDVHSGGDLDSYYFSDDGGVGVRPVIVVNTSDIQSS